MPVNRLRNLRQCVGFEAIAKWQLFVVLGAPLLASLLAIDLSFAQAKKDKLKYDYRAVIEGRTNEFRPRDDSDRNAGTVSTDNDDGGPVASFVGGSQVAKEAFNNLVKIIYTDMSGRRTFCTGVKIGKTKVLTAAHCSCGDISSYRVFFGNGHARRPDDFDGFKLISNPIRYPGYSCLLSASDQPGRDLAILITSADGGVRNLSDDFIQLDVTEMAIIRRDLNSFKLIGAGFGATETNPKPEIAVSAVIPIFSYFCSRGTVAQSPCAPFREFVLADPRSPRGTNRPDSCGGDSGAPIFWTEEKQDKLILVGITSRALRGVQHDRGTTCGGGGIYTSIGHPDVTSWLENMGIVSQRITAYD